MTDAELAEWMGLTADEAAVIIPRMSPERRATLERMAEVEGELMLWQAGVGKKPSGVIICGKREIRRA